MRGKGSARVVAAFALSAVLSGMLGCESKPLTDAGGGGTKLDADWELRNVASAAKFNLASARGKVVFLNIWATWCPPCVKEMPSIARLYEKLRDNPDVVFVLVSVDDKPETALSFLEDNKFTMPTFTEVTQGSTPSVLRSEYIPVTFIIGPDGVIERSQAGGFEWDDPAVVSQIEGLAKKVVTKKEG